MVLLLSAPEAVFDEQNTHYGEVAIRTTFRGATWVTWGVVAALGAIAAIPGSGLAQEATPSSGGGSGIFGHVPEHLFAAGSMVLTIHPFIDTSRYDLITDRNDGGYLRVSQFFVATFRNSYHGRSWVVAVERHWGSRSLWKLDLGLGYRAGIVTGYDERLIWLAEHTPVLPIGGVVASINAGAVGGSVFWAYRAIALEANVRCC